MAEKLRGGPNDGGANIIMLTTESNSSMKVRCKEAGIKGWTDKTFDCSAVLETPRILNT